MAFEKTNSNRKRQLSSMIVEYPSLQGDEACYYCGMPASTIDHVIPISFLATLKMLDDEEVSKELASNRRIKVVPACSECNRLAGASYQECLHDRKLYIHKRLQKRYRNILATKHFTEEELSNLGETLKTSVAAAMRQKEILRYRLGMPVTTKSFQDDERE